jgi:3-dehydroquinate synthase
LGGGVVTDLGGFVASTFKRGIDFIHVPTTLLAMVDASVGGKNGVDLGHLKNQIGVINVPKMVLIDSTYLETLPQNEMRSGLAEMLKHGLIYDANYWKQFLDLSQLDFADFDTLIYQSIEIKNNIVMQDPTENGIRKALNFGHTLGHAIESYFLENEHKKTLLHGEAIAAGMILESYLSWQKQSITEKDYLEIKNTLNSIFERIVFEESDLAPILDLLIHDKKNEYGTIQFALLDGVGKIKINQTAEKELIIAAFLNYKT